MAPGRGPGSPAARGRQLSGSLPRQQGGAERAVPHALHRLCAVGRSGGQLQRTRSAGGARVLDSWPCWRAASRSAAPRAALVPICDFSSSAGAAPASWPPRLLLLHSRAVMPPHREVLDSTVCMPGRGAAARKDRGACSQRGVGGAGEVSVWASAPQNSACDCCSPSYPLSTPAEEVSRRGVHTRATKCRDLAGSRCLLSAQCSASKTAVAKYPPPPAVAVTRSPVDFLAAALDEVAPTHLHAFPSLHQFTHLHSHVG